MLTGTVTPTPHSTQRPHLAAVVEDRFYSAAGWLLRRLRWRPRVEAYSGYGTPGRVRVLARVLLAPRLPTRAERDRRAARRGFRHFLTVPSPQHRVRVQVGGASSVVRTDRAGYVDVEVDLPAGTELPTGWQHATLTALDDPRPSTVEAPVLVIGGRTRFSVVSDVDDTTMVTAVPRPLLAAWNTFVRHAGSRRAVPGMPALYRDLQRAHPDAVYLYLSTGAWNTAATLRAFLARQGYPPGPLLLTDWGPTLTGWFRSGRAHKRASLDLLMSRFPDVRWLLVGDDGQNDVAIYTDAARRWPGRVQAIAIRNVDGVRDEIDAPPGTRVVQGADGGELCAGLAAAGIAVVPGTPQP